MVLDGSADTSTVLSAKESLGSMPLGQRALREIELCYFAFALSQSVCVDGTSDSSLDREECLDCSRMQHKDPRLRSVNSNVEAHPADPRERVISGASSSDLLTESQIVHRGLLRCS
jgi:hypothetical protein